MKNNLFLSLAVAMFLPVVAQAENPMPKQLVGKWSCVTEYPEIDVVTRDISDYGENGSVRSQGRFEFKFANHEFLYSMKSQGKWQLNDNRLTLTLQDGKPQRIHGKQTQKLMQQNELIRDYEAATFGMLNKRKPSEQYFFRIDEITPKQMVQTQLESAETDAKEMAKSVCTRL